MQKTCLKNVCFPLELEGVQKGLGEMKTLAEDVGGLKKVLSNVKLRGGVGEVQLQMLLEQYLAPNQYEANVKCKPKSDNVVEFAIKFPGPDGNIVWLPIDSKFPQDKYEQLLSAYDSSDKVLVEKARKEARKVMAGCTRTERSLRAALEERLGIVAEPFIRGTPRGRRLAAKTHALSAARQMGTA